LLNARDDHVLVGLRFWAFREDGGDDTKSAYMNYGALLCFRYAKSVRTNSLLLYTRLATVHLLLCRMTDGWNEQKVCWLVWRLL
jgi:hypothetical protein